MDDRRIPPLSWREQHLLTCAARLAGRIGTPGRIPEKLFLDLISRIFPKLYSRGHRVIANFKNDGYLRPVRDKATLVIMRTMHPKGLPPSGEELDENEQLGDELISYLADRFLGRAIVYDERCRDDDEDEEEDAENKS